MDAHQSAYIDKHVIILGANAQSLNYTPKMHLFMKKLMFFVVERIMLSEGVWRAVLFSVVSDHCSNKRREPQLVFISVWGSLREAHCGRRERLSRLLALHLRTSRTDCFWKMRGRIAFEGSVSFFSALR